MSDDFLFADDDLPAPRVAIEFDYLPSINDLLAEARYKFGVSKFIKRWREIAERHVVALAGVNNIETENYLVWVSAGKDKLGNKKTKPEGHTRLKEVLLVRPLAIEIRCWRPDSREYDVHNIFHKPIFDGFVDARLFKTDSVKQVKEVACIFEGVDRALAPTSADRAQRAADIAEARLRNRKVKREPMRARFRVELFELAD